jgi:hypothetical protein
VTARQALTGALLLAVAGVLLIGCAGLALSYVGTAARPDNRLPLEGLRGRADVWQTRDVAIHYTTARDGEVVVIDGRVERLGPIKNFAHIDDFRIWLHFIDADGIVIASRLLWAAGVGGDAQLVRWTFSRRYGLPARATAFGFSYRGAFSETGGDQKGQADWEVQQRP